MSLGNESGESDRSQDSNMIIGKPPKRQKQDDAVHKIALAAFRERFCCEGDETVPITQ